MPLLQTPDKTFALNHDGELMLSVCPPTAWSDERWRAYLELIIEYNERFGRPLAVLNFSPPTPSATQRAIMKTYASRMQIAEIKRFAVLSESAIVRGVMTALGWLIPVRPGHMENKPFKPSEVDVALGWLAEVARFDKPRTLALYAQTLTAAGYDPTTMAPG